MAIANYSLDTFVSQNLSKLIAPSPKSLVNEFPERDTWLNQFVLRRMFHNHISEDRVPLAFTIIRRTDAAIDEWELACIATARAIGTPSWYFKALRHFESCVAALWQGLEFGRRALDTLLFEKGDDSVYQRISFLYNKSRHFDPQSLPASDLHALWITNDGLSRHKHSITFQELREMLQRLARIANMIATKSELPAESPSQAPDPQPAT